jgi:catechol 2,3-dioxygenase-like lactoylglutathione lyase family enzyme
MGIPGIDSGMLRLVEWTPSGEHAWSAPARFQDLGAYAVNFRVKDANAAWDLLGRSGAIEKAKPTYWEPGPGIAAWDSQCQDPDGTVLDVFQVVGEIENTLGPFAPGRDATEAQTLAIHCQDARASARFYTGLGFETLHDQVLDPPWPFPAVPPGVKLHNINLVMRGERATGRVELAQYLGAPGRSSRSRTAPPSRGPLMMSIRVSRLDHAAAGIQALGAKPIGSARYASPPFGLVAAATFFGPCEEVIELFEAP